MEKKTEKIVSEKLIDLKDKKMTRKEAIRKSGYIAVSAATMMILISSPNKANAQALGSPAPPPAVPWP